MFCHMIRTEIKTGHHIKNPKSKYRGIGRSYFHLPNELKKEIEGSGFGETDIRGVIGPCWLIPNLDEAWKNAQKKENILSIVRMLEKEESIMGLSTHIVSISRKEQKDEHNRS